MSENQDRKRVSVSIPVDRLGPPGHEGNLVSSFVHKDDPRSEEERLNDTTPRRFEVSCSFQKCHPADGEIGAPITPDTGGSYLRVPDNVEKIKLESGRNEITLSKNKSGELSCASMACEAASHVEAVQLLTHALTPWLDYYAFRADVPVVIGGFYCIDLDNRITSSSFVAPHGTVTTPESEGELDPRVVPVYALYREAKASRSNYYRFLCYYQILEALYGNGQLRADLFKSAREQGIALASKTDRVPIKIRGDDLPGEFASRAIGDVFTNELTKEYRNNVAHFRTHDGEVLNPSSYAWNSKFAAILRVAEACVRRAIESYEDLERQFVSAGGKG